MNFKTRDYTQCAMFAAVIAICAQISIRVPVNPVPFTMQVFACVLAGTMLGARKAFVSLVIYVLIGALGVPVFAGFVGGIGIILGPTGGFILGFPIIGLLTGYAVDKYKNVKTIFVIILIANLIDYLFGTMQFMLVMETGFKQGILTCILPFIIPDIIQIFMAIGIGLKVRKVIKVNI